MVVKSLITGVTFGADPELFLQSIDNGQFVSAVGRIGGTKAEPKSLPVLGSAVQEDNVAIEFNIAPCVTKQGFVHSLVKTIEYLQSEVAKQKLTLVCEASALFPEKELDTIEARTFGCDPDFNAWLRIENEPPMVPDDMWNLRSAGGHLHIGYNDPNAELSMQLIKTLDIFVGAPAIEHDTDTRRRLLYGKAGAFRFKPYGVEYRTLSNFWLHSQEKMEWVFDQTQKAIDFVNNGGLIDDEKDWHDVIQTINFGNKETLSSLKSRYPI
jgi:hypothetical protein